MPRFWPSIILAALFLLNSCSAKKPVANVTQTSSAFQVPRSTGGVLGTYIDRYKDIAISEMQRTGVPASIKLAQGMLESDYGRSRLAVNANNHFGIKCHSGWQGATISHNDDAQNECFRKYRNSEESFYDHSNFLTSASRYKDLFKLKPEDYKGWARGLKKAGYATDPNYANLLIGIIEKNDLWLYDREYKGLARNNTSAPVSAEIVEPIPTMRNPGANEFVIHNKASRVKENNRIRYIVVNERDTREDIERNFSLLRWELSRYNEFDSNFELQAGQILYLQPKRNKAEAGKNVHNVTNGDSMYSISQQYGVKLKKLYEMNRMQEGEEPKDGDRIWLREMRPVS